MNAKKSVSLKTVAVLLTVVLLIGCAAGGTLAWLSAQSASVTNTFTVGDINIELKEHELAADGETLTKVEVESEDAYKILPGTNQPKDPFVRVKANSENCWVFVQVKEENNDADTDLKYVTWAIADGWTKLGETVDGVSTYYRATNYKSSATEVTYAVLSGNMVSYSQDLTKAMIDALRENKPVLTFKAFAVQEEAATNAADAWTVISTDEKLS